MHSVVSNIHISLLQQLYHACHRIGSQGSSPCKPTVVYIHPVGTIESQQGTNGEVDGDLMGTTNISPDPTSTLYMNQC